MDKNTNSIKAYPIKNSNNDTKNNRNQITYNSSNRRNYRDQAGLTYEQALELQKRITHVENELKKMQDSAKSKIVIAPLKEDVRKESKGKNQNKKTITCRPVTAKEIQTYRGPAPQIAARLSTPQTSGISKSSQTYERAIEAYNRSVSQAITMKTQKSAPVQVPTVVHEEKTSLWQKIKKAVKEFFGDEPKVEKKTTQSPYLQDNSNSWGSPKYSNDNYKYNQFRQNVPKTTIQIDPNKKSSAPRKQSEHVFDRYA